MKVNVIVKADKKDSFAPKLSTGEERIFLESIFSEATSIYVTHNIKPLVEKLPLIPQGGVEDFGNLSLAVYVIDQLLSRTAYGYQGWSRYFKIFIPVVDVPVWNNQISQIESMLSFLTGDKWEVEFRQRKAAEIQSTVYNGLVSHVSLFSGGLDSLIGTIDLLSHYSEIALISHHKGGGGGEKSTQASLVSELQNAYPAKKINSNLFYVQPLKGDKNLGGENTQRARSLMFIALGLLVANGYGKTTTLLIPENALISLNIPLTMSRYGTYSTKTTHPKFIETVSDLLSALSIGNRIDNPYKFKTKGEMLKDCADQSLIQRIAYSSTSCSKTNYYKRWTKKTKTSRDIASHCGHCVPCIIRRSAFYSIGADRFEGNYHVDVQQKSNSDYSDLRAFKIGLHRFNKKKKLTIFDIFKGGIFSFNSGSEMTNYLKVYQRGMKEVEKFIYKR